MRLAILALVVSIAPVAESNVRCREDACWGPSSNHVAKAAIEKAEAELARGNSKRAAYAIGEMFSEDAAVEAELDLIAAVGALRSGLSTIRGQNPAKTIRLAHEAKPDDARIQALHAESLLRGRFSGTLAAAGARARRETEALRILTRLETRELLTAHGWAALARAHHLAGATMAARTANARCEAMAVNRSICAWALR